MKFPRNARIFRGQLDAAPFISVFFLLVLFLRLGSHLYPPGVRLELPSSGDVDLPGTDQPTVSVAVTATALYYKDEPVSENELSSRLKEARQSVSQPLTLVIEEDKDVTAERLMNLTMLALRAGITNLELATLPRVFDSRGAAPTHS